MEELKIIKNRNRKEYSFANINLLGKCNADCFFCLGKDIEDLLSKNNKLNTHFNEWKNFDIFVKFVTEKRIKNIFLTGQNCDALQYKHLEELNKYFTDIGFEFGIRTNGILAKQKIDIIKKIKGEKGYTINSLKDDTNYKIMKAKVPDWEFILKNSGDNVRVSIVVNRYNINEIDEILKFCSKFDNIRYIQIRRISTDTRFEILKEDIEIFEKLYNNFLNERKIIDEFYKAQVFEKYGKKIVFWRTVETEINSVNYFVDGTFSTEYFVIEGYLKNYKNVVEVR